jgi:kinesin family protein 4/21/27
VYTFYLEFSRTSTRMSEEERQITPAAAAAPAADSQTDEPAALGHARMNQDEEAPDLPAIEVASEAVRVAVRVRPLSEKEELEGSSKCVRYPDGNLHRMIQHGPSGDKGKVYTFDSIFHDGDSQESVYRQVSSLVDKVTEGFNATILAYGQTGSGKTHTMGSASTVAGEDGAEEGVIPRALAQLFTRVEQREALGDQVQVNIGFLEIYQEEVFDLLNSEEREDGQKGLPIREEGGVMHVAGAKDEHITSCNSALEVLQRGSLGRATGATNMNAVSSRSHAIYTVTVHCTGSKNTTSKLHFVDLAGSERAKRTGAGGQRLKEGININAGLLSLGKVISALSDEKSGPNTHVPYRESKLTRMLQDSLGGNSLTYMICCISPADTNYEETMAALNYANRAKMIKNKPTVNEESNSAVEKELRIQLQALQQELQASKHSGSGHNADDFADLGLLRTENENLKRYNDSLEVKVSLLMRDTQDMSQKVLDITNECDHLRLQVEAGAQSDVVVVSDADGSDTIVHKFGILQQKNEEIAKMREKIQALQMMADIATDEQAQQNTNGARQQITAQVEHEEAQVKIAEKNFSSRQQGLELEIRNIDSKVAMKEKMAEHLATQGKQFEKMKNQYARHIGQLETEIQQKHKERDEKLRCLKSQDEAYQIKQRYEDKITALRKQLLEMKNKQKDAAQNLALQKSQTSKYGRVMDEMDTLKREKVALRKRMKEEAVAHREWKTERELELRQLRRKQQKTQYELSKLEGKSSKQEAVLRRKHEDLASAQRRIKEMERSNSGRRGNVGKGRLLPGDASNLNSEVISMWLSDQVKECSRDAALKRRLKSAIARRRELAKKIVNEQDAEELETMKEEIQFRTEEIQGLQVKLGVAGDRSTKLLTKVKRAADMEELRQVLIAGIELQVQSRLQIVELEKSTAVAEETAALSAKNLVHAKTAFERKCLEDQQEYEENMAGLLQTIATQDEAILGDEERRASGGHSSGGSVTEAEFSKLRTMYNAVVTAHQSSEREVKRMKKTVERAEQTMRKINEENIAQAVQINFLNGGESPRELPVDPAPILPRTAAMRTGSNRVEGTSSAEAELGMLSVRNENRVSLYEKEMLREKMTRRRREDSVVLQRQSSQSSQNSESDVMPASREAWGSCQGNVSAAHAAVKEITSSRRKPIEKCDPQDATASTADEPTTKQISYIDTTNSASTKPANTSSKSANTPRVLTEMQQVTLNAIRQEIIDDGKLCESSESEEPEKLLKSTISAHIDYDELDPDPAWLQIPELAEARAKIVGLTVGKLKEELKTLGTTRTGKKQDLVVRLLETTRTNYFKSDGNDFIFADQENCRFSEPDTAVESVQVDLSDPSMKKKSRKSLAPRDSLAGAEKRMSLLSTQESLATKSRGPLGGQNIRSTTSLEEIREKSRQEHHMMKLKRRKEWQKGKDEKKKLHDHTAAWIARKRAQNGVPKEGIRRQRSNENKEDGEDSDIGSDEEYAPSESDWESEED